MTDEKFKDPILPKSDITSKGNNTDEQEREHRMETNVMTGNLEHE